MGSADRESAVGMEGSWPLSCHVVAAVVFVVVAEVVVVIVVVGFDDRQH
jgi:hypothetical protein